jgi:uncharacterized membrane protein HdeD (DUF308 family)
MRLYIWKNIINAMTALSITTLLIGAWMILQGILHDIFVLRSEHGKQYDRNLLRLLMDGHILITCGAMQIISAIGLPDARWAYYVAATASISLLVYCVMIYPFLKSFFTMLLNVLLLVFLAVQYVSH